MSESQPRRPTVTHRGSGSAARKVSSSSLESSSNSHSSDNQSAADAQDKDASDCDGMEECIDSMVAQRDQLRKRFKEWADDMSHCAKKMRCVTDNALVNQSTRLEQILSEGKARVDGIVDDQNRIREQLASFVSMLSNAQTQIFGDTDLSFANAVMPSPVPGPEAMAAKRQFARDSLHG